MKKSLLTLLTLAFLSCNNSSLCDIPKGATVKFVSIGDMFSVFGNEVKFSCSTGDTAWFEYLGKTGGLRRSNDFPYEFPPDTMINWKVVYLRGNSAGVAYWEKPVCRFGLEH